MIPTKIWLLNSSIFCGKTLLIFYFKNKFRVLATGAAARLTRDMSRISSKQALFYTAQVATQPMIVGPKGKANLLVESCTDYNILHNNFFLF